MRLDVVIEFDLAHFHIANGTLSLARVHHLHVLLHVQFDDFLAAYLASLRLFEVLRQLLLLDQVPKSVWSLYLLWLGLDHLILHRLVNLLGVRRVGL